VNGSDKLEQLISAARFAPYVAECGGDRERGVALYHWSARLAGAIHVDLGYFEIAFRNLLNDTLTEHHSRLPARHAGSSWFDPPRWVRHRWWDAPAQAAIDDACRRAHHGPPYSPRPDAVVAELGFGFWRYLVTVRYEQSLWVPILDHAFTGVPGRTAARRRATLDSRMRILHRLRNRVAHHEPLFKPAVLLGTGRTPLVYGIDQQAATVFEGLRWIDPVAADWIRTNSVTPPLLRDRP
jgi:hypothetical protein